MEATPDLHRNVGFLGFTLRISPEQPGTPIMLVVIVQDRVELLGAENERFLYHLSG